MGLLFLSSFSSGPIRPIWMNHGHEQWSNTCDDCRCDHNPVCPDMWDEKTYEHICKRAGDGSGQEAYGGLKGAELLDILKDEIGDLLEGVEGAPDQEDVDADAGEDSIAPATVED